MELQISAHEIGHAVAMMHAGLHVERVRLKIGGDGECTIREDYGTAAQERGFLVGLMAGHEAATYWRQTQYGKGAGEADPYESRQDYADFAAAADTYGLSEAEARSDAMQIVINEWDVIYRCAHDLAALGTLTGRMIR
jgi:hypothetical protein